MAWHHKECWDEHGGCSVCPRGASSPAATKAAPKQAVAPHASGVPSASAAPAAGSQVTPRQCATCIGILVACFVVVVGGNYLQEWRRDAAYAPYRDADRNARESFFRVGGMKDTGWDPSGLHSEGPTYGYPHGVDSPQLFEGVRQKLVQIREGRGGTPPGEEMSHGTRRIVYRAEALELSVTLLAGDRAAARERIAAFRKRDLNLPKYFPTTISTSLAILERLASDGEGPVPLARLALEGVWPWHWERIHIEHDGGQARVQIWHDGSVWRDGKRIGSIDDERRVRRVPEDGWRKIGSDPGGDVYRWKGQIVGRLPAGNGQITDEAAGRDLLFVDGKILLGDQVRASVRDGKIQVNGRAWGRASGRRKTRDSYHREFDGPDSATVAAYLIFFTDALKK